MTYQPNDMDCPKCGSKDVAKSGLTYARPQRQRWFCHGCGQFSTTDRRLK